MPLSRLAEQFARLSIDCRNEAELSSLLDDACMAMGFSCHALVNTHYFLGKKRGVGLITYPAIWQDKFVNGGLFRRDPMLMYGQRSVLPFDWAEALETASIDDVQRAILAEAAREGLAHGLTVPVNMPGEPPFSCSFARPIKALSFEQRQCAWIIGAHAIDAARRLRGLPIDAGPAPHLSPRELETLRWIAAGKTDLEIALIFGRSVPTVRTYVSSLLSKFDVISRTLLPVRAIQLGLIGFEDAIGD